MVYLVAGNPGTGMLESLSSVLLFYLYFEGNSWFLSYWLYRLAQEKKTVAFESVAAQSAWLFLPSGEVKEFEPKGGLQFPPQIRNDAKSFFLFDPAQDSKEPTKVDAFTVVASPDEAHFAQFDKRQKFYMPPWTEEEIDSILPHLKDLDVDTVKQHFEKYGGVIRFILRNQDDFHHKLEAAIQAVTLDKVRASLGGHEVVDEASHKLLHYETYSPYVNTTVRFASPYVAERVASQFLKQWHLETLDFITESESSLLASVRGVLFESETINRICRDNCSWNLRNLKDNTLDQLSLQLPHQVAQVVNLEGFVFEQTVLYKPKSKKWTAVDAFLRVGNIIYLLQMTVSHQHPTKGKISEQMEIIKTNHKNCALKLVFVVPDTLFPHFQEQNFLTTKGESYTVVGMPDDLRQLPQLVLEVPLSNKRLEKKT